MSAELEKAKLQLDDLTGELDAAKRERDRAIAMTRSILSRRQSEGSTLHKMEAMPLSEEELADIEQELEELTDQAAETDKRIEAAKEGAAEAKEGLSRVQRRLAEKAQPS